MIYTIVIQIKLDEREVENIAKEHLFNKAKWKQAIIEYLNDEKTNSISIDIQKQ